jgi:hypothetical protein
MSNIPIRKKPGTMSKGFSTELANQLNKAQATKVQRKIAAPKVKHGKVGQGYTQHRTGVDHL